MNIRDAEPWQDLANAIVVQAAQDYRFYRKAAERHPDDAVSEGELESIEKFFTSSWCDLLSAVDGSYILKKLREEGNEHRMEISG